MRERELKMWTRPFSVAEVIAHEREVAISATAQECAELARFCGFESLETVEASFALSRRGREKVKVLGEVRARGKQLCVVTLEPFDVEIVEPINVDFSDALSKPRKGVPECETEADDPEPIIDGKIDLAAVAREFLCLGVDPYPKKPGAVFDDVIDDVIDE